MLIANSADVNTGVDMFNNDPLFAALFGQDEDIAEMLINNSADINS